jgi:DNA-directed RNA polymerase specialized sigma24 family protein
LTEIQSGNAEAANQLLNLIQLELRQIAVKLRGDWQRDQTLQSTLLLDMAWERLVGFEGDLKKIVPTTLLVEDIKDPAGLARALRERKGAVSGFIHGQFSEANRQALAACPPELPTVLSVALNGIIKGPLIYEAQRFQAVPLRPETQQLLERMRDAARQCGRLNRMLLEDAYPAELARELHKEQFLRFTAITMKRILWESKQGKKNQPPMDGGDALDNLEVAGEAGPADRLIAVQDAVDALAAAHPQPGRLVKLLCYEDKTIAEAAQEMQITLITAKRRWEFAKTWLYNKLEGPARDPGGAIRQPL